MRIFIAAEQSRVLHGVAPEPADAVDDDGAARTELSGCSKLFHAAVRGQPGIGQRGQRLGLVIGLLRYSDDMAVRHRHVLRETTGRSEPDQPPVGAQLLVAFVTLPALPVTPVGVDHDQVALGEAG